VGKFEYRYAALTLLFNNNNWIWIKMDNQRVVFTANQMEEIIRGLYLGILGRDADKPGLANWSALLQNGADIRTIVSEILISDEYHQREQAQRVKVNLDQLINRAIKEASGLFLQTPITVVDVGAQNLANEKHIYEPLIRHDVHHQIIGFEPLDHRRQERLADSTGGGSVTLLPAFIGDGKKHIFNINAPDATSSLLPFNRDIIERFVDLEGLQTAHTELVSTITLDEALVAESVIHFLKLDIQGFELQALQSAQKTLARTLVVHCEVSFMEIYKNQPLFSEVEQFLRGAGFELMDLRSICHYPFSGTPFDSSRDRLGWADAVFFRKIEDKFSWKDRVAQSLIALTVYKKPSLAAWLVRELNDTPADSYCRTLNAE
jgi:FkbM family methyltransferase